MLHFIQMVGIPGSGKSSKAEKLAKEHDAVLLASDKIRSELFGDASDQTDNNRVFSEMLKRTKEALESGKSVVYDATNISHKRRRVLLQQLKAHYEIIATAVVMATPINMCIDRQKERKRIVGDDVIIKMAKSFYIPYWYEGWDDIQICYPKDNEQYMKDLYREDLDGMINHTSPMYDFNQHNPHHKLSLGEHMYKCYEICCKRTEDESIREAALLHDIGKVMTQEFEEDGMTAHYLQHHHISAYLSLFERNACESHILRRAVFIQWHMSPYLWKEQKTFDKYHNLFGDAFYENLMMLHECDKEAH